MDTAADHEEYRSVNELLMPVCYGSPNDDRGPYDNWVPIANEIITLFTRYKATKETIDQALLAVNKRLEVALICHEFPVDRVPDWRNKLK